MSLIERRRPAHGILVPRLGPLVIYITCCSKSREPWMATGAVHAALRSAWDSARAWHTGRYVVMPDHVHLFASPREDGVELETWMRYWKRLVTRSLGSERGKWQDGHWDTRMRTQDSYREKLEYVLENPVRKGLVARSEDWPFSGEVHVLDW